MRIILCDDDEEIRSQLLKYLREFFQMNHLSQPEYSVYSSGDDLLTCEKNMSDSPVDIAFLDVEMPGRNGIYTGALLKEKNPNAKIIIVTSYLDYLDEAMRFHVFRYLSKPIDKLRLFRNMKDALYQISIDTKPVSIITREKTVICSTDEIIMIENEDRKVWVHTLNETLESVENAKYWDMLLAYKSFFRPHRSYIINFKYLFTYSHDTIQLKKPVGGIKTAYLTRRKYQDFKDAHLLYLEAMS